MFNISYIFEIQDKMTSTLNKISGQMQGFSGKIKQETHKIQDSFNTMTDKISTKLNQFDSKVQNVSQRISRYIPQAFKDAPIWAELYIEQAGNKIMRFNDKMQKHSEQMLKTGAKASVLSLPLGFYSKQAVEEYANYQQMEQQMQVAFGKDADIMIKKSKELAYTTALSAKDVFSFATSLKQSANMTTEEVMPFIENFTKSIYSMGAGGNFQAIKEQIIQGLGRGELERPDIKVIQSWGMPIMRKVAETLGKTVAEVQAMIAEKGGAGITNRMVVNTMARMASEDPQALSRFGGSARGTIDAMMESHKEMQTAYGELLVSNGGIEIMRFMRDIFNDIKDILNNMSPTTRKILFYFVAFSVALAPVSLLIGGIVASFGVLVGTLGFALKATKLLFSASSLLVNPYFLIAAAIVGIIASIIIFRKEIWNAMKATGEFLYKWTGIQFIIEGIGKIFKWIESKIDAIINKFNAFRKTIGLIPSESNEGGAGKRPKPISKDGGMSFMEGVVKSRAGGNFQGNMNINFGNIPKGTSIETTTKGADYMKLGVNSAFAL